MSATDPSFVAQHFIRAFYSTMSERPDDLYRFYKEESEFIHVENPQEKAQSIRGLENIRRRISELKDVLYGAKLSLEEGSLDAQPSESDSVSLAISGHVTSLEGVTRQYMQYFYLISISDDTGRKKYVVRNSIFRILASPAASSVVHVAPVVPSQVAEEEVSETVQEQVQQEDEPEAVDESDEAVIETDQGQGQHTEEELAEEEEEEDEAIPDEDGEEAQSASVAEPVVAVETETKPKTYASFFQQSSTTVAPSKPVANAGYQTKQRNGGSRKPPHAASVTDVAAEPPVAAAAPAPAAAKVFYPSLYVSHLPSEGITKETLSTIFSPYGHIRRIDINARGYAFVEYDTIECLNAAIAADKVDPDRFVVSGRKLNFEERAPRGSGGGHHRQNNRVGRENANKEAGTAGGVGRNRRGDGSRPYTRDNSQYNSSNNEEEKEVEVRPTTAGKGRGGNRQPRSKPDVGSDDKREEK